MTPNLSHGGGILSSRGEDPSAHLEVEGMKAGMARTVRVAQGSLAWHDFRKAHIGSSDAPVIAGESPYRSALDLFVEKTSGDPPAFPDLATSRLFRVGHHMESVILDLYGEEKGTKVRKGRVLESREIPWLAASLDGETDGRIVEAKTTSSSRWADGVPSDVVIQVTHQMAVAGVRVADVAVWNGRTLDVHEVPFDRDLWDSILLAEIEFRERIRLNLPPRPDGSESSRRAISRLFPDGTGDLLEADAEVEEIVHRLLQAKERAAVLDGEIGTLENAIRFLVGDHAGITGPDFQVTYRKNKDSERVSWADYASALERIIVDASIDADLATVRGIFTNTVPGPRVLRVKGSKG